LKKESCIFRVASHPSAGGGHINRSLALAEYLSNYLKIKFVIDNKGRNWIPYIKKFGFDSITIKNFRKEKVAISILDGYKFSKNELQKWRKISRFLTFICDYKPNIHHYNVALFPSKKIKNGKKNKTFSGLQYALINKGIRNTKKPRIKKRVHNILVCFGVFDSKNATGLTINILKGIAAKNHNLRTKVLMTSKSMHLNRVKDQIKNIDSNIDLVTDKENIIPLLCKADLSIGSAGNNLLERTAMGIPSITITTAKNQDHLAKYLNQHGSTINLGSINKISVQKLETTINRLIKNHKLRLTMSRKGKALVDGLGVKRSSKKILNLLNREKL
jgi:spore coat polysaccharide biosynthesis predicted glycosyltransferase SpsG|tara:strand:+ start:3139 stop:4131 length:993 start_codon:yes stop_codon:yes gene_type:complete